MKDKPALKAYMLNTRNLDQSNESIQRGYIDIKYGKNEHEARRLLLKECYDHGICEDIYDNELTYISIRIKRFKERDKYLVDGKLKTREQIDYDIRVEDNRRMLLKMLSDNPGQYAYIRKGGYFYCANYRGYTELYENAGVYTIEQAVKECLGMDLRDYMLPELIDIEVHNKRIDDRINSLYAAKI